MTSNEILKADLLDIVFNNRNKLYGAYALRKYYDRRLVQSLGMALSFAALLFFFIKTGKTNEVTVQSNDPVVVKDIKIYEAKKIVVPPTAQRAFHPIQKIAQKQFTTLRIIQTEPLNKMPDQTDLEHTMISDHTSTGIKNIFVPSDPGPDPGGNIASTVSSAPEKESPLIQREPEFPGGTKAWLDFLRNNLQVPQELEAGEKRTVLIRFQVATDGMVTAFEIMKTAGRSYDNEVIRVLKKMPKWKPAIRDNVPVATSFTQPVTFIGLEE